MDVRLATILNGLDDESNESMSTFAQSVVAGILLYGAEHKACETMPGTLRESVKEHTPEPAAEPLNGGIFSAPIEPRRVVEQPKIEVASQPEPISQPEESAQVENMDSKQEEQADKPVEEPSKKSFNSPKRGEKGGSRWMDKFRSWVDGIFTEDEFIE